MNRAGAQSAPGGHGTSLPNATRIWSDRGLRSSPTTWRRPVPKTYFTLGINRSSSISIRRNREIGFLKHTEGVWTAARNRVARNWESNRSANATRWDTSYPMPVIRAFSSLASSSSDVRSFALSHLLLAQFFMVLSPGQQDPSAHDASERIDCGSLRGSVMQSQLQSCFKLVSVRGGAGPAPRKPPG